MICSYHRATSRRVKIRPVRETVSVDNAHNPIGTQLGIQKGRLQQRLFRRYRRGCKKYRHRCSTLFLVSTVVVIAEIVISTKAVVQNLANNSGWCVCITKKKSENKCFTRNVIENGGTYGSTKGFHPGYVWPPATIL